MSRRVVITGMGALTPVGNSAEATWCSLIAGTSGIAPITHFNASALPVQIAGEVKGFDPSLHLGAKAARTMDRTSQLAVVAARQAVADAGLTISYDLAERCGLALGSAGGGVASIAECVRTFDRHGARRVSPHLLPNFRVDSPTSHVAIDLGLKGPTMAVVASCATGTANIGEAAEIIRRGDADVMLAGGTEAIDSPVAFASFTQLRVLARDTDDPERACKPFDARRDGFVLAEGAVVLVLESEEHARERRARIYAELAGYGATNDAYHLTAEAGTGDGAARAMRQALRKAGLTPETVDYVNAHGSGTRMNDVVETRALKAAIGQRASWLAISATKSMTGHMMGATGACEALVCTLACRHGMVPPTINLEKADPACDLNYTPLHAIAQPVGVALSNSIGLGGHNATLVVRRFELEVHSDTLSRPDNGITHRTADADGPEGDPRSFFTSP